MIETFRVRCLSAILSLISFQNFFACKVLAFFASLSNYSFSYAKTKSYNHLSIFETNSLKELDFFQLVEVLHIVFKIKVQHEELNLCKKCLFIYFYFYIYPPNLQESNGEGKQLP